MNAHFSRIRWSWLLFLGSLAGLGWTFALRPSPSRWQASGRYALEGFTPDKRAVVTSTWVANEHRDDAVPRKFSWWELDSGKEIRSVETDCSYYLFAADYGRLAAGTGGDFWIIDTQSRRKAAVAGKWGFAPLLARSFNGQRSSVRLLTFSPSGRWLARRYKDDLVLIDTVIGTIAKQWSGVADSGGIIPYGGVWFGWSSAADLNPLLPSTEHLLCCMNGKVTLWDAGANQSLMSLGPYRMYGESPQGRFFVAGRIFSTGGGLAEEVAVLDLKERRRILEIPLGRTLYDFAISDDDRFLALWSFCARIRAVGEKLAFHVEIWDLVRREKRAVARVDTGFNRGNFSPNGDMLALYGHLQMGSNNAGGAYEVLMIDVNTGDELWRAPYQRPIDGDLTPLFNRDGTAICLYSASATELLWYDVATGSQTDAVRLFAESKMPWFSSTASPSGSPFASKDKRHFVVDANVTRSFRVPLLGWKIDLGSGDEIAVADIEQKRKLAHPPLGKLDSVVLSDDGLCLVACHQVGEAWYLSAWDVPPRRPWLRIIGIPVLLGLALIGLKRGYRRWQPAVASWISRGRKANPIHDNPIVTAPTYNDTIRVRPPQ